IVLPLTFLSSTFLATNLIPRWMQHAADFNPVNWTVTAGRTATSAHPHWGLAASRAGFLTALHAVCLAFATSASRSCHRSLRTYADGFAPHRAYPPARAVHSEALQQLLGHDQVVRGQIRAVVEDGHGPFGRLGVGDRGADRGLEQLLAEVLTQRVERLARVA